MWTKQGELRSSDTKISHCNIIQIILYTFYFMVAVANLAVVVKLIFSLSHLSLNSTSLAFTTQDVSSSEDNDMKASSLEKITENVDAITNEDVLSLATR